MIRLQSTADEMNLPTNYLVQSPESSKHSTHQQIRLHQGHASRIFNDEYDDVAADMSLAASRND